MDQILKKLLPLFLFILMICTTYAQRWDHIYGKSGTSEAPKDIVKSYDHAYIVSGYYETPEANWIFKTDINGDILWEKFLSWENTEVLWTNIKQSKTGELVHQFTNTSI